MNLGRSATLPAVIAASTALAALVSCGDGGEADASRFAALDAASVDFAPTLQVDLDEMERRDSGLYVQVMREGTGEAVETGDRVSVHYSGWLPDGTSFDSSLDREEPFVFTSGAGDVIEGWDRGVSGAREGSVRLLVIPPHLGYGARGAGGVIPPNSFLVFRVEVLEVEAGG